MIQATDTPRPVGVEIVALKPVGGWISPGMIRTALAERGLHRVLVEGGGATIAGFLQAGLLDRLHVGVAPLIIGAGPAGLRTAPIASLADALRPETRVYGLETDVIFDCAFPAAGIASKSICPTTQEPVPATAARRA